MPDIRKQLTCQRCGKSASIEEVKYIPKPGSSDYVVSCIPCLEKNKHLESHAPKTILETSEGKKKVYFCGRCRYKFTYDTTKKATTRLKCPMCGKDDFLNKDLKTSKDVLKEVSKPGFDELKSGIMRKKF